MDYKLLLDTAVLAGEIMLMNGAEIFRVESTISHILQKSGLKTVQAYVTITGIMVTLDDPSIDSLTVVRRISERGSNLNKIHLVNDISRRFCENRITLKEAFYELKHMEERKENKWMTLFAYILCTGSFSILFGGKVTEAVLAALDGIILFVIIKLGERIGLKPFILNMLSAMGIAAGAIFFSKIPQLSMNLNPVIIGAIMPIVPGAAITNAIRDTLQGDYTAAVARMMESFVTATSIALGVGVAFILFA